MEVKCRIGYGLQTATIKHMVIFYYWHIYQ